MKLHKKVILFVVLVLICSLCSACANTALSKAVEVTVAPTATPIPSSTSTPKPTHSPDPTPEPTPTPLGYFEISFTDYIDQYNTENSSLGLEISRYDSGFKLLYNGQDERLLVFNTDLNDPTLYAYSTVELEQFNSLTVRYIDRNSNNVDFDFIDDFAAIGISFARIFNPDVALDSFYENATKESLTERYVDIYWDVDGIRYELEASYYDSFSWVDYVFYCKIV